VERHLTILIIEDDPNDVLLLRKALKRAGIENPIQVVNDGAEAIKYLQGEGRYCDRSHFPFPSVIFTDLKMPRMSGFDVLEWLRSHSHCSVIPIMILSASKEEKDVKRAYQMGANAYLVKPATLNELQEMVKTAYDFWAHCETPMVPGNC
jgi:CheY-like chemotaxis protein